jgi:uncharacterized protein
MTSTTTTIRRIGLISDTHGLVRPEALSALRGCELIVHAGDIAGPGVLEKLSDLAPVVAIRGNHDKGDWAQGLQTTELINVAGIFIYLIHNLAELDLDPVAAGIQVVVSGHTHVPLVETRNGVLFVNPGSAGPRRFTLPIAVAELRITNGEVSAHAVELAVYAA